MKASDYCLSLIADDSADGKHIIRNGSRQPADRYGLRPDRRHRPYRRAAEIFLIINKLLGQDNFEKPNGAGLIGMGLE